MKFLAWLMIVAIAAAARADIIHLTDGTQVEGRIHQTDDGWEVTQSDGKVVDIPSEKVASIEATRTADPALMAKERLADLRRQAAQTDNIRDIIAQYEQFIERNSDPKAMDQANQDLSQWRQRLDQGLVKMGGQWVTTDERDHRRQQAQTEALAAKELIPAYRYKEADKLLQQALSDDPQCATALYLQGVSLYKQEQVTQARKAFEAVNELAPNQAPTLNNLAVIAWREHSFVLAMDYYDKAMIAAPQVKEILDNVAEALNAMPDVSKQAPVVQMASRLFTEQDTALQKMAADHGLYRWGSSWVTAKQLGDLKAAEVKIQQQLDDLQKQYDDLQNQIATVDGNINQDERQMRQLEASSTIVDMRGNVTQMPLPPIYYQTQADANNLAGKKKALQDQQNALQVKAKEVKQSSPQPKFTGVQQLISVEGVPVRDLSGAAPATAPSP